MPGGRSAGCREHEVVALGVERSGLDRLLDAGLPQLDRDLVRNEFAAAGVIEKLAAQGRAQVERAENIAAREVVIAWDRAERAALRAFADTWSPEKEVCLVFVHWRLG